MTVCDRGEGGSKIAKNSVTSFMDGPSAEFQKGTTSHILWYSDWLQNTTSAGSSIL